MIASIQIDRDVLGLVDVVKPLSAYTDGSAGHVRVLGSLGSDNDTGEIYLREGFWSVAPNTEYVCINYDGDGDSDNWYTGSTVDLAGTPYSAPDVAHRLFAVEHCKGDMNNSGRCDFADIDLFVTALEGGNYSAANPWFAGSRVFKGDIACGCDGAVTFKDIDPFVARLGTCNSACDMPCTEEEGLLGGMSLSAVATSGPALSAVYVASGFAANVSATNHDALLDAVIDVAAFPPVTPVTDWAQVAALLSGE